MTGRTDDMALVISLLQDILAVLEEIRVDLQPTEEEEDEEPDGLATADDDSGVTLSRAVTWAEPRAWLVEKTVASFIYVYDHNHLSPVRH